MSSITRPMIRTTRWMSLCLWALFVAWNLPDGAFHSLLPIHRNRIFVSSFLASPKYHTTNHLRLFSVSFNNSILDGSRSERLVDEDTSSLPLLQWEESHMPSYSRRTDNETLLTIAEGMSSNQAVEVFPPKFVVMMNTNARGVSNRSVSVAQEIFGVDSVYSTATPKDVHSALHKAFGATSNKNTILVVMGGDGTLALILKTLCEIRQASSSRPMSLEDAISHLPLIAYIPMGTGNAVGSVVGCHYNAKMDPTLNDRRRFTWIRKLWRAGRSSRFRATLQQLRDALLHPLSRAEDAIISAEGSIVELPMLEITTTSTTTNETLSSLCFFAGVGFDSIMLNDFKEIKEWSMRTGILRQFLSSVAGYFVALVCKTLPQTILRSSHKVQVQVTTPKEAWWVDHRRGDFVQRTLKPLLFEGETGIVAGSTVPFYGGRLRLFPFARMTVDQMHLRLGRIHPWTGFINIPSIYTGSYRDTSNEFGVLDFIGSDFTIHVSNPSSLHAGFPLQHSGESVGPVSSFRLRVLKTPIRFWSFLPDR